MRASPALAALGIRTKEVRSFVYVAANLVIDIMMAKGETLSKVAPQT